MVGGGSRRDEGSFTVSNTNVFAALESLRKKKKSDKGSSKGGKSTASKGKKDAEAEKQVYWAPAPLTVKSWADVDDEDDDDYYATTAPPQAIWGGSGLDKAEESRKAADPVEESESEDELLDEGDDEVEEENDHESEIQEQSEPVLEKPVVASPAPKETERQLSKKERRKKELAELEAILADFGVNPKEKAEDESSDVTKVSKEGQSQSNGDADKKDEVPVESKTAKKKKKKASKEAKEAQDRPDTPDGQDEATGNEQAVEDASTVDVKEKLKKMASTKKKKSNKEMDAAARAAALEAAARNAKLANAKKKEKNHYNQQPTR